ncbi:UDP-glucose 6-dehydrogenase [Wielerella bovis]|uniref:UDP-glucose 6-dehydrogenase n=1 Tax=Wielerella bovis TaxID=2917790 RepID=UPI002019F9B6|nr:UDP-glucose 6-dehydrogenase [Wielerella bovis]ULJ60232.1 UDP-glucose 6-dehydrogenase [Wielerella bovis]
MKIIYPMLLAILCAAPVAQACSQISPDSAFILNNDKNKDGALNQSEWRGAKVAGFFVELRVGDKTDFVRLDKNRNRLIDGNELDDKVRYRREPCADWEERMNQLMQQEQQSQ